MDPPVAADVAHVDIPLAQHTADQQATVAIGRILFTAHQCHAIGLDTGEQSVDPLAESGRLGHLAIEDMPLFVVELLALGPAADLEAEKQILQVGPQQRSRNDLFVEVRSVAAVGAAANVDHDVNLVLP